MVKIKNERGITLIALVLTIVITIILAAVTIDVGTDGISQSKTIAFVSYMQAIQKKVDLLVEYNNYEALGNTLTDEQKEILTNILSSENETFITTTTSTTLKYFDSNLIENQLEIDNVDDEIVIDFATREVISLNGIKYENKMYYTQYKLPGGQALVQFTGVTRQDVQFNTITASVDGLNASFTISGINITNGTLSYSMDNRVWTTVSNYTIANENITTGYVSESGTYYFKLTDNITGQDNGVYNQETGITNYPSYILRLANAPKLEGTLELVRNTYNYSDLENTQNWAYARDDENNEYVWIPRFAYETLDNTNIEFLRGTSDVTTSGGFITSDWTLNSSLIEKTGVWVITSSYSTNDIIEILENGTIL